MGFTINLYYRESKIKKLSEISSKFEQQKFIHFYQYLFAFDDYYFVINQQTSCRRN